MSEDWPNESNSSSAQIVDWCSKLSSIIYSSRQSGILTSNCRQGILKNKSLDTIWWHCNWYDMIESKSIRSVSINESSLGTERIGNVMSTSHRNKQEKATDSSMSTWWIRDVAVPFDGTFDRFLYAVVLFPSQLARAQPFDRNIRQRPTERGWSIENFGNVLVGHRRLATSQQITTDCVGRGNERIFQKPLPILDWIALDRKNSYPKVSPWRNRELFQVPST